jgi:Zn-dependent protease
VTPDPTRRLPFAVRIHPQFLNLFFLLLVVVVLRGDDGASVVRFVVGFALTALALLAHELGHALVARRAGIVVDEVVVHPFGGMAKLLWGADDPRLETRVAAAGPATNLALAAIAWIVGRAANDGTAFAWILTLFVYINLVIGLGNLLPAFPMDGGRIVRALMSMKIGRAAATRKAARLGRFVAVSLVAAPFVAATATSVPAPYFIAAPVLGGSVFLLGEWERLKEAAFRPPPRREAPPPEQGVVETTATSRVVD